MVVAAGPGRRRSDRRFGDLAPAGRRRAHPGARPLDRRPLGPGDRAGSGPGLATIAFPAISTGIYGYPLKQAAQVAVKAVRAFLEKDPSIKKVVFAVLGEEAEAAYRQALKRP